MRRSSSLGRRERVVAAIANGLSCRQAAVRSGGNAAGAVRWQELASKHRKPVPQPHGGDRRPAFDDDRDACRFDWR